MNKIKENTDWAPVPEGYLQQFSADIPNPYEQTLIGEFARLFLLLAAIPLVIWFCCAMITLGHGMLAPLAAMILLTSLLTTRGAKFLRISLLALMAVNVLTMIVNVDYMNRNGEGINSDVPALLLLACLIVALLIEMGGWFASLSNRTLSKVLAWGFFTVPAVVYIAGIPLIELLWESIEGETGKLAVEDPNWKLWNEVSYRSSEFVMFGLFTYVGACIGSFLNVVAYSVPRGQSFGFRDSSCPYCNSKITRIDNLPIFSYVNLGGRCRSCKTHIPARYLIAELVAATIFGSLFVYQLITGSANVPSTPIFVHQGVLWIVLYPKWPVIAIYLFHALFMSGVLVLAIIEWDRKSVGPVVTMALLAVFFVIPLIYWPLQPVSATQFMSEQVKLASMIEQLITIAIGGIAGVTLGFSIGTTSAFCRSSSFRLAVTLTGIVLGWQALLQIAVLFLIGFTAIRVVSKSSSFAERSPSSVWLVVIMLHHPFWKTISNWWI